MPERPAHRPIEEFRAGGLKVAIWRSEVEDKSGTPKTRYSVRISKRYYDNEAKVWRDTEYYFANELPRLRMLLDKAFEFIVTNKAEPEAVEVPDDAAAGLPQPF